MKKPTSSLSLARWGIPLLIVMLAVFLKSGFFSYLFYALTFLWLISNLLNYISYRGVRITRELTDTEIKPGENVKIRVTCYNEKSFPILWFFFRDWFPNYLETKGRFSTVETVASGGKVEMVYQVTLPFRGYYRFGPVMTIAGDVFGLARTHRLWDTYGYVTVLPEIHDLTQYLPLDSRPVGEFRVQQQIYDDPTRIIGIRDYRHGDSLRYIHWKATARTGKLRCKLFESTKMEGALLILDLYTPDYESNNVFYRSELMVKTAASLAHLIAARRQKVGILSNGYDAFLNAEPVTKITETKSVWDMLNSVLKKNPHDRITPVKSELARGDLNLHPLMQLLGRLELSQRMPLWRMLLEEYPGLSREVVVICMVPKVNDELVLVLREMKHSGFSIRLFQFSAESSDTTEPSAVVAGDIPVFYIKDIGDVKNACVRTF